MMVTIEDSSVPDGWLPEFWHNPFTRALGLPPTLLERIAILDVRPVRTEAERSLPHDQRKYCALRLFDLMVPIERQVDLGERIHMVIRQGYKGRDPSKGLHKAAFNASASALAARVRGIKLNPVELSVGSSAILGSAALTDIPTGFALIGDPGMGKSRATDRFLAGLPQTVVPETPYHLTQITYLKIQCPSSGGSRQFCLSAFDALDRLLGTNYASRFQASRLAADHMMLQFQHLATLHAIGLIVVDELQHMLTSKEGWRPLMNFIVSFVNLLGVPVMLIGTNEARPLLEGAFREARRATGLGQPNWARMKRGDEWDDWLDRVWSYQWTNVATALTPELSEIVYDESQGIIDIAVKLLVLTQLRAISRGEISGGDELMSEKLIRKVAKDEFGTVAPMLSALRDGREDVLRTICDLTPLHQHVDGLLCRASEMPISEFKRLSELRRQTAELESQTVTASYAAIRAGLIRRGHALVVIDRVLAKALTLCSSDDIIFITETVIDLLSTEAVPAKPQPQKTKLVRSAPLSDSLLHAIGSADPHAVLAERGVVASVSEILAA